MQRPRGGDHRSLLVAAAGLAVFTLTAVALCAAGYARGPRGLVWSGRGTLSHMAAPRRERTALLVAIAVLAACLVSADVMCARLDRRCWLRLATTVLGVGFLFATISVDIRKRRTLHNLLFVGFMLCLLAHGALDVVRRRNESSWDLGCARQGAVLGLLLAVFAAGFLLRRRYRATVAWAEVVLFPLTLVLVLGCYV